MPEEWRLIDIFRLGGIWMWPLLVFSIITLALSLERCIAIIFLDRKIPSPDKRLLTMIEIGKFDEVLDLCRVETRKKYSVALVQTLVNSAALGESRMVKDAELLAAEHREKIQYGFEYLRALAVISPLVGSLGTVIGLIGAFRSLANALEVSNRLIAIAICTSLIPAAFGLGIAMVATITLFFIRGQTNSFSRSSSRAANRVVQSILTGTRAQSKKENTREENQAR